MQEPTSHNEINESDNNTKISHNHLIDFLLCTDQPFSVVENDEFKNFITALNPKFKISPRNTLMNTINPNKVFMLKIKIQISI